jgi:hypothetical protein
MHIHILSMLGGSIVGPIGPVSVADFEENAGHYAVLGCVR